MYVYETSLFTALVEPQHSQKWQHYQVSCSCFYTTICYNDIYQQITSDDIETYGGNGS